MQAICAGIVCFVGLTVLVSVFVCMKGAQKQPCQVCPFMAVWCTVEMGCGSAILAVPLQKVS